MTYEKSEWRETVEGEPCPTCDAPSGSPCLTRNGHLTSQPHAGRYYRVNRCPHCGVMVPMAGELCDRCALIRSLETERASHHRRTT